ncbi:hypothetical protein UFOVP503_8 [uncultured Caudovirales phage]|uniref:Uncharacterized protein n=1 Tax=uncultured Caudovirales phage TaxID=2100421 RepID=A0A6J5NMB8_9CAUD|nr:hypothetical protein UFOVP503_8 [uncultured Caudovirales phage]CAB4160569.1 hypothetical protein UFOVP763_2 [uncultured Caudovirales phage]
MAQNTSPIFPLTPVNTWVSGAAANAATPGVTANTTKDLTSGTIYGPIFTGKAVDGSRLDFIKSRALGTNIATVIRIWINNGSATGTAANNTLFLERTIAATTVSETAEQPDITLPLNLSVPAGYRIYATFGTAVAAGFHLTAVAGDY